MSSTLKISGALRVGKLASAPASPEVGFIYYDTGLGEFQMYKASGFVTVTDKSDIHGTDVIFAPSGLLNISGINVQTAISNLDAAIGSLASSPTYYTPSSPSVVASHLAAIDAAIGAGGVATSALDGTFRIKNTATNSKQIAFDASGIAASTVRTITMPNVNVDLGKVGTAIQKDGSVVFTADQSMGSHKITNLTDPVSAQDAATKNYVDSVAQGLKPKTAVRVGTTANINLASAPATIDGITLASGNRVLVKNQTSSQANGIYVFNGAASAMTRATDMDSLSPLDEVNGAYTFIQEGTSQAGQGWVEQSAVVTLGTDPMVWIYFNDNSQNLGGDMITLTGTTFSIDLATVSGLESTNPGNVAGQLRIKLEASSPSLKFSGSNELGVKLDGSGAILSGASGIAVQVDGSTIEINSNALRVKDAGITLAKLASASVDENKIVSTTLSSTGALLGGSGTKLSVSVDGSTLEINTNALRVKDAGITNAKIASGVDAVKIGTGTVSNTVFGYLANVSSDIQAQINAKLSSVSQDTAPTLGGDLTLNSKVLLGIEKRGSSNTNFLEEEYFHALSLLASQTNAVISSLTFATASFEGCEVTYKIHEATTNNIRIGRLWVATNGTVVVLNDTSTETGDIGVSFDSVVNGANINIRYTSANANALTMRADVKRIKA